MNNRDNLETNQNLTIEQEENSKESVSKIDGTSNQLNLKYLSESNSDGLGWFDAILLVVASSVVVFAFQLLIYHLEDSGMLD